MLSVAASRLVCFIVPVFLGLTPQANYLSPLRGFTWSPHEGGGDPWGTGTAISRLHMVTPRRRR